MITVQTIIVLSVLFLYVPIGRFYRIGKDAKTLIKTKYDRGSTNLAGFAYLSSLFMIGLGVVLTYRNVASFESGLVSWIGVAIILMGFLIRLLALFILGRFYTRTIRITHSHRLVMTGPYKYIRHPGYLGVLLIFIGAGLAISNWISLVYVCLVMPLSLLYRIQTEEMMMMDHFGEDYRIYMRKTWPLIPYLCKRDRREIPEQVRDEKAGMALRKIR